MRSQIMLYQDMHHVITGLIGMVQDGGVLVKVQPALHGGKGFLALELSLNIKVGNMIATIDLNKTDKNIYVHYYYAIILSGQISLNVHSEFKWVPHTQLKNFTYIDGDRHILNYL